MSSNQQTARSVDILLVEDNPGDIRLTRKAFEKARLKNELYVVNRVDEAKQFLSKTGDFSDAVDIDLILLDIQLPDGNGLDVLRDIKDEPSLRRIPVVVLTSSEAEEDIVTSYDRHANAYITKPVDFPDLVEIVQQLDNFWFSLVKLAPQTD